jgi:lipoprotein-anchoring transpeptidase ErfK/SrfK
MSRNPTQMNRRSLLRTLLLPTLAAAITAGGRSALATSDVATPADRPATPLAGSQPGLPVSGEAELFPIAYDDVRKVSRRFRRREVAYETSETPGTIIVDVDARQLYFTLPGGRAQRYGIGVGKQGFEWSGAAVIQRKAKWPRWVPPKEMVARDHLAAQWAGGMPGGPDNPLGARGALSLSGRNRHALSHPWHLAAAKHRQGGVFRLHQIAERRCRRSFRTRADRNQGRRPAIGAAHGGRGRLGFRPQPAWT